MSTFQNINAAELSQTEVNMVEGGTFGLLSLLFSCAPKPTYCDPKPTYCAPKPPACPPPAPKPCY